MGEELRKVLHLPRAAAGNDGDIHPGSQRVQHFKVKALLHAVGVDGVQHDLSRAVPNAPDGPLHGVQAGILPAALGEDVELPVHALDVHGEHHALVAVLLGRRADDGGVRDGAGVHAHLVRAALQNPVKVLQRLDAAAHGQGYEDLAGYLPQNIGKEGAPFRGGGDIVKHQLVRSGGIIKPGHLHRVCHVPQALEVHALHHPAVFHVQAGNDPFCQHQPTSLMTSFRSSRPVYRALPKMAAWVPMACNSSNSAMELTPPEAVMFSPLISANSR